MRSDNLASLLAGQQQQVGFRQGQIVAWDPETGNNTITVAGATLVDIPVLSTSTIQLAVGDTVGLLRFASSYFILGRIAAAGSGALAIRAATVRTGETTSSSTLTDLATPGPTVDAYIGASAQCLVLIEASMSITGPAAAGASFAVSGASTAIDPNAMSFAQVNLQAANQIAVSAAAFNVLTAADGLVPGLNHFTMKYLKGFAGAGSSAALFANRSIVVIPF